ncbi:MAG: hypothetical protein ACFNO7_00555 [Bacteroides sp.]|jgi:hypothetical protein
MGFASITKTRKPRQFNYVPRYYDERKERLQALIARAQEERGENVAQTSQFSTARMQLEFQEARAKRTKRTTKAQQKRTLLILGALVLLLYFYFRL